MVHRGHHCPSTQREVLSGYRRHQSVLKEPKISPTTGGPIDQSTDRTESWPRNDTVPSPETKATITQRQGHLSPPDVQDPLRTGGDAPRSYPNRFGTQLLSTESANWPAQSQLPLNYSAVMQHFIQYIFIHLRNNVSLHFNLLSM